MNALEITGTRMVENYTVATLSDGREIGAKTTGNRWGTYVDVSFIDVERCVWLKHVHLRKGTSHRLALAEAIERLNNPPKVRAPRKKPTSPAPKPARTHPVKDIVNGEGFLWLGTSHRLLLVDDGPAIGILEPWRHQDWLRLRRDVATADTVIDWYSTHGLAHARQVVANWSPRLGLRDVQVKVRGLSKKWGMARRNTITLHWALFQLPRHLVEYVIVHELAHLADTSGGRPHGPVWRRIVDRCLLDRTGLEAELAKRELDVWMGDVRHAQVVAS